MSAPAVRRDSKVRRHGPTAIATVDPPPAAGVGSVASGKVEIEHQEIARLAYSYWVARGCQEGSPEEDWLRAERQLRAGN